MSKSGNENRDSRRLARQLQKYNESQIRFQKSVRDIKTNDGKIIGKAVGGPEVRDLAKRDKKINKMYAKLAKKYADGELRSDTNVELGKSIVSVILTDKKGNVYDSGYIGNYNPNAEKKKKKQK